MAFYGGDFVTKQVTAIAWKFIGELRSPVVCECIGKSYDTRQVFSEEIAMLEEFRSAYDSADIVTGHYIRGFDLPLINARMVRHGLPLLSQKLVQDTKGDLARASGMSKSQENLGAMLDLASPKVGMNTTKWEEANALTPRGIAETINRVVGDVRQHIELRQTLLDLGYLSRPREWSPNGGPAPTVYAP
jgi:DNA polymerase elongation subunit (family B)